jgi:hypothetical protein
VAQWQRSGRERYHGNESESTKSGGKCVASRSGTGSPVEDASRIDEGNDEDASDDRRCQEVSEDDERLDPSDQRRACKQRRDSAVTLHLFAQDGGDCGGLAIAVRHGGPRV